MIELRNINKSFGTHKVLDDISISFESGKTNLIIGQSGSGKTVLLKSIIGLHEVDSGEIFYNERNFTEMNFQMKKEIRKEMGMVFQGGALFDSLTVEENVMFPLDMFTQKSLQEKRKRADFCLDRVNLKEAHKLYPSEISGGMQKRVAIARAIALNPQYLFCDEPNSGLDPVTAILIDNLIQEITKEFNMTTIINTHDMNSVMEIGEKIIFINKGRKAWEGTKEEIFHTQNEELNNFVFASDLYQKIRDI
ncbi:MAG: ABC transporter ATP-binding protein [Marinifilaceae bacterium]